jgi:hypothetical protein
MMKTHKNSDYILILHPTSMTGYWFIVILRVLVAFTFDAASTNSGTMSSCMGYRIMRPSALILTTTHLCCQQSTAAAAAAVSTTHTIGRFRRVPVAVQWSRVNDLRNRFYQTTSTSLSSTYNIGDGMMSTNAENMAETDDIKHYIFGYGSLMCPLSRQVTNANLMNKFTIPILIQELERAWCARTTTGYTAMGVQFVPNNNNNNNNTAATKRFCTGILIGTIDSVELEDLDRREASYDRLPV